MAGLFLNCRSSPLLLSRESFFCDTAIISATWFQLSQTPTFHYDIAGLLTMYQTNIALAKPLVAFAFICTAISCASSFQPTDAESIPETMSPQVRSLYSEVILPPETQRFGTEPGQIALDAFGSIDPIEGNFSQDVELLRESSSQATLSLTQIGLLDDSVEGIRYLLEFEASETQWELVWAGRQIRCYPGRGSQDWSTDLCS